MQSELVQESDVAKNIEDKEAFIGSVDDFVGSGFMPVRNDLDLKKNPFYDKFLTEQQEQRDKEITELLHAYVENYKEKVTNAKDLKIVTFIICIIAICTVLSLIAHMVINVPANTETSGLDLVALLAQCITLLGLFTGILKVMVEYIFPKNEEEYITDIVKIIQANDLKNKIANIEVSTGKRISHIEETTSK